MAGIAKIVLARPETVTLHGDPSNTWVVDGSCPVLGQPGAVCRATVEIKSQITLGSGGAIIRQFADDDISINMRFAGLPPKAGAPIIETREKLFPAPPGTR